MNYTVIWVPAAEQELAALWLNSSQRDEVRAAADEIDEELARHPGAVGESRAGEIRIFLLPPLGVRYLTLEPQKQVYVLTVWSFSKRSKS